MVSWAQGELAVTKTRASARLRTTMSSSDPRCVDADLYTGSNRWPSKHAVVSRRFERPLTAYYPSVEAVALRATHRLTFRERRELLRDPL
jgi:hypothetical protein